MKLLASDKGVTLIFEPTLTFQTIEEERASLKQALDSKQPVVLRASDITQVDMAGLQLLLAFITTLDQAKINYSWDEVSPELRHAATIMGLSEHLHFPN